MTANKGAYGVTQRCTYNKTDKVNTISKTSTSREHGKLHSRASTNGLSPRKIAPVAGKRRKITEKGGKWQETAENGGE